jgi:hypothetical protein
VLSGLTGNNGVFAAGQTGLFPTQSYNANNYWVDVTFRQAGGAAANEAPVFTGPALLAVA